MDHGHKRRINSIMEKFTVQLVFPKKAIPKSHIELYLAVVPVVAEATFKKFHSYVLNTILNSKGRAESPESPAGTLHRPRIHTCSQQYESYSDVYSSS